MLFIKYTKTGDMRFVGHLDIVRHFDLVIARANLSCNYSQGFNPHRLMFFSSPLGLGIESLCEYVNIDTNETAENFKAKFNLHSNTNIQIISIENVDQKVNVMAKAFAATYKIKMMTDVDTNKLKAFSDKVLDANYSKENRTLTIRVCYGQKSLRPDKMLKELQIEYDSITKTEVEY